MPLKKTAAIILKSQKLGETSKILTFYTRAFGKIKTVAKGARSSKSRFGGSLEPLNYVSLVFYEKENRDLQTLSQADIIEPFLKIRTDLEKTTLALACCELLDRIEVGVAPSPPLFKLLLQTLRGMNQGVGQPADFFRAYQVQLFEIMGIQPNLSQCLKCGLEKHGKVSFDLSHGGFYCDACQPVAAQGLLLSHETLKALRTLQTTPVEKMNGQLESRSSWQQLDAFLNAYLKYHVEGIRDLNALKVLRKIKSKLSNG